MDLLRKKGIYCSQEEKSELLQCLSAFDLIFFGVGAIIGAGIFILTGIVASNFAGPGVVFSYILAGLACVFAALSYAELAASVGGCGSAYGYAYAGFGEFFAWIVGWDLLLEYTISVAAVSVGWSAYAADFLKAIHLPLPVYLLHGPIEQGIINLPCVCIIALLTFLLVLGVKSSSRINNLAVCIKLFVIALFIVIALTEFKLQNWHPFLPFGWAGVIKGSSLIFFAYVGFDAVSTAAEEAMNPQRDLPRGIIGSLLISTLIYIVVAGLLTGMAHYSTLNVASPISHALYVLGYKGAAALIGVGAVAGLTTVMLVLFYGLTRVLLALSRDGLLPQVLAKINAKTHTPVRIIALCGFLMALLSSFTPLTTLAELVNVGTLFAFVVVCLGVMYLRYTQPELHRPFKVPGMPYVPLLGVVSCLYLMFNLPALTLWRFLIWMFLGLVIYFLYSHKNSALAGMKPDKESCN